MALAGPLVSVTSTTHIPPSCRQRGLNLVDAQAANLILWPRTVDGCHAGGKIHARLWAPHPQSRDGCDEILRRAGGQGECLG